MTPIDYFLLFTVLAVVGQFFLPDESDKEG